MCIRDRGVGVFGRNHARVYQELEQQGEPVRLAGVVDPNPVSYTHLDVYKRHDVDLLIRFIESSARGVIK